MLKSFRSLLGEAFFYVTESGAILVKRSNKLLHDCQLDVQWWKIYPLFRYDRLVYNIGSTQVNVFLSEQYFFRPTVFAISAIPQANKIGVFCEPPLLTEKQVNSFSVNAYDPFMKVIVGKLNYCLDTLICLWID